MVWAECARKVTFLSNITAVKSKDVCPYQLLFGSKPRLPKSLRSFGEIGVVTTKSNIQGKLRNRGTVCMFVGYSVDHAHDVYRMLNLETNYIINSRDITYLELLRVIKFVLDTKIYQFFLPQNSPKNRGFELES